MRPAGRSVVDKKLAENLKQEVDENVTRSLMTRANGGFVGLGNLAGLAGDGAAAASSKPTGSGFTAGSNSF